VKHIQDALDKPDFIWDSLFIENIGLKNVDKWYRNPLKADIQAFKKDNTIYDAENPYFSYIYKVVLYEKYAKFLLEDKKKHKLLIETSKIKSEKKTEELKNTAAQTASTALKGIYSLLSSNKISKLEKENEQLKGGIKQRDSRCKVPSMTSSEPLTRSSVGSPSLVSISASKRNVSCMGLVQTKPINWFMVKR